MVDRLTTAWIFIATDSVSASGPGSCFQFSDLGPGDVMNNQESDTESSLISRQFRQLLKTSLAAELTHSKQKFWENNCYGRTI